MVKAEVIITKQPVVFDDIQSFLHGSLGIQDNRFTLIFDVMLLENSNLNAMC